MFKRTLFFWIDRLQITPAERIFITTLFASLLIISSLRAVVQPALVYDEDFYKPIEAEFNRLSAIQSQEEASLLNRYYPQPETGTKESGGAFLLEQEIPGSGLAGVEPDSTINTGESEKININTAGPDQLTQLPGIGPVIAKRIVAYRDENGAFGSVNEIRNVAGIGSARLEQIKPYITL